MKAPLNTVDRTEFATVLIPKTTVEGNAQHCVNRTEFATVLILKTIRLSSTLSLHSSFVSACAESDSLFSTTIHLNFTTYRQDYNIQTREGEGGGGSHANIRAFQFVCVMTFHVVPQLGQFLMSSIHC